jgi:hypothetical protein
MFTEDTKDLFEGSELEDTRTETQKAIQAELKSREDNKNIGICDLPMFSNEYQIELF